MNNKKDLFEDISKNTSIAKKDVQEIFNLIFINVEKSLKSNEEFAIPQFGKFKLVSRQAREARNPRTGEKIKIPAQKAVVFRPSKTLKMKFNN
ncbi:MAG: transcriptional regulator [Candidatus Hepatoplasma scabrum]|nr:MAG: transcriptional regulator [Candidatus Hepatoplasma sp.]